MIYIEYTINLENYIKITVEGLQYLREVYNINLDFYKQITDQSLRYLTGKSNLTSGKLEGVYTITLDDWYQITYMF